MISDSGSTGAGMLTPLVCRYVVRTQCRQWSGHAARNMPFLTSREDLILKILHYPVPSELRSLASPPGYLHPAPGCPLDADC
jgi:hypothetical protein